MDAEKGQQERDHRRRPTSADERRAREEAQEGSGRHEREDDHPEGGRQAGSREAAQDKVAGGTLPILSGHRQPTKGELTIQMVIGAI